MPATLATAPTAPTEPDLQMAISVRGLQKYYGDFHALKNIDLDIANGEIVVICGPSGSGKSSLIRCINHLEQHNAGTIHVNGVELLAKPARVTQVRRDLGMVFQNFNLFPHMTVLDNCTFALRLALHMPHAEADKVAREHLEQVNVLDQAGKYPGELSGGQQQRVAIARALCLQPRIMLFDEPTSALDPESVGSVLRIMEKLAATGITMMCVTHEIGFARRVAHRCVFMERGEIVENGPTERFFSNPDSPRLKAFLDQVL